MTLVNVMICRKWSILSRKSTVWLCDFNEQPN